MSNGETEVEKRVRDVETKCASRKTAIADMAKDIADHETRLRDIEKLTPALKIAMYTLSILAGSVIALIWSLITGQANIMFQ